MKSSLFFCVLALVSCSSRQTTNASYTAFVGATLIDGTGAEPIQDGVLLIRDGRVDAIGGREQVSVPPGATVHDVSGRTIMPGIINAHGHVGDVRGIEAGNYSRKNIIDNLKTYARYGVTTVVSLGGDGPEANALRAVNDSSAVDRARLFIAGEVITGATPEEAVAAVDRNHQAGVDFMKIRVDDNLGANVKMNESVYRSVINRSHELGYRIATHLYYLEDARKLLEAGTDLLAHSVRDQPVDESFVSLLSRKEIGYCPTLTRELSAFVYGDTADFFSDPFFLRAVDEATIKPLMDPVRQQQIRDSRSAQTYKQQLPVAMKNLKTLSDRGVPIVFGTDSGMPTRFIGYFEHLEMEMMADAGMTPAQIIVSATKNAAVYMGLKDLGTLSPNHWADFIILDANPLENISHVRKMVAVYIGGKQVSDSGL